ncbi:hypothetical protein SAMN05720606_13310 [Paenibacillus polysaccharolyticus]|uniref:Integron gene cassette protein n=2 Tax=Paenibacillus TaxID=44249 RepID=A0A1G5LP04_9BACL|nr:MULTISPECIES: hypothetical protein [Paenibacillus]MBY0203616.1 hypothetical protein [Paenibacillus cucumis (ex Kampfer et al. 2016)]MDP9702809.1 hypothetical protein [Paenibacillus intestini]SCZ14592.1 hypothetical protein SAMN05720606_13310 [Paenibacillus polysaccharolyticus]
MEKTAQDVAEWMVSEIKFTGTLRQEVAIEYVRTHYGEHFVFVNENGNASLSKEVKKAFRKLHGGRVAWDRDAFMWAWT